MADARPSSVPAASAPTERPTESTKRWPGVLAALAYPQFRLPWLGLLVSNVGIWMQMVTQGWLVYTLTDSPFFLGLVGFARAVPVFGLALVGGALADRVDRRRVMLVTNLGWSLCSLVLGVLTVTGLVQVWHVVVLAFISAGCFALEGPARQSLMPELVPRRDMVNAIGLQSAPFNGAGIVGPTIAALVIDWTGLAGAFFGNFATALSWGP